MKITPEIIAACKKAGACKAGLAYICVNGRTIEQLYEWDKEWFFWLKRILSKPARDTYNAAEKTARDAYHAAMKPASDAYNAAEKTARDAYYAAVKPALIDALRKTFA